MAHFTEALALDPLNVMALRGLGAQVEPIEAPFEPEPGAYDHNQHDGDDA